MNTAGTGGRETISFGRAFNDAVRTFRSAVSGRPEGRVNQLATGFWLQQEFLRVFFLKPDVRSPRPTGFFTGPEGLHYVRLSPSTTSSGTTTATMASPAIRPDATGTMYN